MSPMRARMEQAIKTGNTWLLFMLVFLILFSNCVNMIVGHHDAVQIHNDMDEVKAAMDLQRAAIEHNTRAITTKIDALPQLP